MCNKKEKRSIWAISEEKRSTYAINRYKIYSIFYIFYLKIFKRRLGDKKIPDLLLPELINDAEYYNVEKILGKRNRKRNVEYLVKWLDYGRI